MRQIEMASSVARVLRVLLTNHKEKQQRLASQTSETSSIGMLRAPSPEKIDTPCVNVQLSTKCPIVEEVPSDQHSQNEDEFSLQETLPEIIQACRSSRLQLIHLAPRLLEESAHTSNSNVSLFVSTDLALMKHCAGFSLRKRMFACDSRIVCVA